jgi:hypothetical protein
MKADIAEPPTVVIARGDGDAREIEFMCARLQKVVILSANRSSSS